MRAGYEDGGERTRGGVLGGSAPAPSPNDPPLEELPGIAPNEKVVGGEAEPAVCGRTQISCCSNHPEAGNEEDDDGAIQTRIRRERRPAERGKGRRDE
jgi:hypothetical protein